jgi:hypothetical protein
MEYENLYSNERPFYYDPEIDQSKIREKRVQNLADATITCIKLTCALMIATGIMSFICYYIAQKG